MSHCYCPCDVYAGMSSSPPVAEPNLLVQSFDPDVILHGRTGTISPVSKQKGQGGFFNISFYVPPSSNSTTYYVQRKTIKPHYAGSISIGSKDASVFQWHGDVPCDVTGGFYPGKLVISLPQRLP